MLKWIEDVYKFMFPFDLPVLKEMPAHVRDVNLDIYALAIHIAGAQKPTDRTHTGYTKAIT